MINRIVICTVLLLLLGLRDAFSAEKKWMKLRGCELIEHAANDGDSFHVSHEGDHYIFRLCFVDTPETSQAFPSRVKKQAKWWRVSKDDVIQGGEAATEFTKKFLAEPFTVFTQLATHLVSKRGSSTGGWQMTGASAKDSTKRILTAPTASSPRATAA